MASGQGSHWLIESPTIHLVLGVLLLPVLVLGVLLLPVLVLGVLLLPVLVLGILFSFRTPGESPGRFNCTDGI